MSNGGWLARLHAPAKKTRHIVTGFFLRPCSVPGINTRYRPALRLSLYHDLHLNRHPRPQVESGGLQLDG